MSKRTGLMNVRIIFAVFSDRHDYGSMLEQCSAVACASLAWVDQPCLQSMTLGHGYQAEMLALYPLLRSAIGLMPYLKQVLPCDLDILTLLVNLVGLRHVLIKDLLGQGDQGGVGHPGAVMPILHLPQLVCLHLYHQSVVWTEGRETMLLS